MGKTRRVLARTELPPRLPHNSRMFVDIGENVHIHHREFRHVFSLAEFREYARILASASDALEEWIAAHPEYTEMSVFDTLAVFPHPENQFAPLTSSPAPHASRYMDADVVIEELERGQRDEIHVHWRDFRFAIPADHLRRIAGAFTAAAEAL